MALPPRAASIAHGMGGAPCPPSLTRACTRKSRTLTDLAMTGLPSEADIRASLRPACKVHHKRKSRIVVDLALEQRQQLMLGSVQIAGAGARFSPHDQIERRQAQSRCADVDKR